MGIPTIYWHLPILTDQVIYDNIGLIGVFLGMQQTIMYMSKLMVP